MSDNHTPWSTLICITLSLLLMTPGCGSKDTEENSSTATSGETTGTATGGETADTGETGTSSTEENTEDASASQSAPAVEAPATAGNSKPHPYIVEGFEAALVIHPAKIFASEMMQNLMKIPPVKEIMDEVINDMNEEAALDLRTVERFSFLVKHVDDGPGQVPEIAVIAEGSPQSDFSGMIEELTRNTDPHEQDGMKWYVPDNIQRNPVVCLVNNNTLVFGAPLELVQKVVGKPAAKTDLNDQLVALDYSNQHVVAIGNTGVFSPRMIADIQDALASEELPPAFSGITDMVAQVKSISGILNITADLYLNLGVTTSSEENTTEMVTMVNDSLTLAKTTLGVLALAPPRDMPQAMRPLIQEVLKFLASIKPKQTESRMDIDLGISASQLASWQEPFLEAVTTARTAAQRSASLNNLKQIGLALHNYHDTYRQFPVGEGPNIKSKDGKPLLSWRVHLLPFIEQDPLYSRFKLDEPWDSPHNIKLADQIPITYVAPNQPDLGNKTTYLAPVGPGSILGSSKKLGFRNITDGTSLTIMIVQVAPDKAVPWTKPEDVIYDVTNPVASLGNVDQTFSCLFADGSVRTLPVTMKPKTLLNLFNMFDGEDIDFSELNN